MIINDYSSRRATVYDTPVIGVIVAFVDCGVHIISYEPVEILVTANADFLHVFF